MKKYPYHLYTQDSFCEYIGKHIGKEFKINNLDKNDWNAISCFHYLPEDFIRKYLYCLNHQFLCIWQNLSTKLIQEKFIKDPSLCYYISMYQKLPITFIEKNLNKLHVDIICRNQILSETFIERHKDKVDWYNVSSYQELSEKFIERHKDELDWESIVACQNLSEKFIIKYKLLGYIK